MIHFPTDRATALTRLHSFAPRAGFDYAAKRNYDDTAHVSTLSPYLRHRIITEQEVVAATLRHHSPSAADKFIAEVYWRTYWKGWLERRPTLWTSYKSDLQSALNAVQTQDTLRRDWEAACLGQTGIDCFDHWAQELAATGYLHNHARMWFASIWVFTLRLPWTLGADFFMRHLIDGDAASNTLSWRWVAGMQTIGKTYAATPDNIAKYTNGRFNPKVLAKTASPLPCPPHPALGPVPISDPFDKTAITAHLITDDDLSATHGDLPTTTFCAPQNRSPLQISPRVHTFTTQATAAYGTILPDIDAITAWAISQNATQIVMNHTPTGPTADALAPLRHALKAQNITLSVQLRPEDSTAWAASTAGFFKFKSIIPTLLRMVADCTQPRLPLG